MGRDPRCSLVVADPATSRLQLTFLRLHRRWAVFHEGGDLQTLLNEAPLEAALLGPGDRLRFGETQLLVQAAEAAENSLDLAGFEALRQLNPVALTLELIAAAEREASAQSLAQAWAERLFSGEPGDAAAFTEALRAAIAQRARAARAWLVSTFGAKEAGGSLWNQRFDAQRGSLPPQARGLDWPRP